MCGIRQSQLVEEVFGVSSFLTVYGDQVLRGSSAFFGSRPRRRQAH